jgi:tyrosyl-DNA phosphodiesterase-1
MSVFAVYLGSTGTYLPVDQSVWLQDVPARQTPIRHDPKADDFPATLQHMLHSINVAPALKAMINDNVRYSPR